MTELADRRGEAVERLMICRKELLKRSNDELILVSEIDEAVSVNLRRIGADDPELIVADLERMAVKAGNAL